MHLFVCVYFYMMWKTSKWGQKKRKRIARKRKEKRKVLFISSNNDNNNEIIFYPFDWANEWMLRANARASTHSLRTEIVPRGYTFGKIKTFSSFKMTEFYFQWVFLSYSLYQPSKNKYIYVCFAICCRQISANIWWFDKKERRIWEQHIHLCVYLPSFSIFSFWQNNDWNNQSMSLAVYLPHTKLMQKLNVLLLFN